MEISSCSAKEHLLSPHPFTEPFDAKTVGGDQSDKLIITFFNRDYLE